MKNIFFDLETTGLDFVHQILNYSFIETDEQFNIVSELSGKIRVARHQIPEPLALLANRVDILEHQADTDEAEPDVMIKIREYISKIVRSTSNPVNLIGYNIIRFDLPFLRTSMIRNGVNPYFGKKLVYKDLMHVSQALATNNLDFYTLVRTKSPVGKINLRLGNLVQNVFQLDDEEQSHESRKDVLITIELAKHYLTEYGINIDEFQSYEPKFWEKKGMFELVFTKVYPSWDSTHHVEEYTNTSSMTLMALHEESATQALWIDLDKWKTLRGTGRERESLFWYNKNTSAFFVIEQEYAQGNDLDLIAEARKSLEDINLKNFFPPKFCDIEQFIYAMSFDENAALYDAIWMHDVRTIKKLNSKFASELFLRYLGAHGQAGTYDKHFKKYVMYRYSGEMEMSKFSDSPRKHPTYSQYLDAIEVMIKHMSPDVADKSVSSAIRRNESIRILTSLKEFILQSDITKLCGEQLLALPEVNAQHVG